MKTTNFLKIVTCSLTLVAFMSVSAFAAVGQPKQLAQEKQPLTAIAGQSTVGGETEEDSASLTMMSSGKVTDIAEKDGVYTIYTGDMNTGITYHVQANIPVIDQKTGEMASVKDIKKEMTITAIYPKNAPMALSLPPQTSAAICLIINSDNSSMDLSVYNDQLVNEDNTLKLNIAETTKLIDLQGTKKALAAEDLQGSECLVLYTVSTRSIPAQTTPELVMIINSKAALEAAGQGSSNGNDADSSGAAQDPVYVELRSNAEAKGYTVTWQSATQPILLTKEGMTVEVTIGSDQFKFEHLTKDIKPLDQLKQLDSAVKLENGKTMVPKTFIEAL